MESKDTINFHSKVASVEEKFFKEWLHGVGQEAVFQQVSRGWFVRLAGSHESLFAGFKRPNIEVGDEAMVRITFYGRQ